MSAPQGAGPSALLLGLLGSVPSTTRTPAPGQGEEGRGTARLPSSGPHWLPQPHPDKQHPLGSWPGPGSGWGAPVYGGEGLAITLGSQPPHPPPPPGNREAADPALSRGPMVCTEPSLTELLKVTFGRLFTPGPAGFARHLGPGVHSLGGVGHRGAASGRTRPTDRRCFLGGEFLS